MDNRREATDLRARSIFGVEDQEVKEDKRFTFGVATVGVGLVKLRASLINLRNYVSSIAFNTSSVALVNAEVTAGPDAENRIGVLGDVLSAEVRLVAGANEIGISL